MKQLLIIRHAKSGWANIGQRDIERTLNERGHQEAILMAKRMEQKKIPIDFLLSSSAVRTRETCLHFADILTIPNDRIQFDAHLYHASADTLFEVVSQLKDKLHSVALFAHNPGITDFVNQLNVGVQIDDMPTAGIFAIELENWKDIHAGEKKYLFFDYPNRTKGL
jgi:phosphohistidine phosphatase